MGKRARNTKGESGKEEGKKTVVPPSFDSELDALFSAAASSKPEEVSSSIPPQASDVQENEEEQESDAASESSAEEEIEQEEALEEQSTNVRVDEEDENDSLNPSSDEEEDEESETELDPSRLVHESVLQKSKSQKKADKRKAINDEPQEVRDRRSIFVGNLPVSLIKSRPGIKALKNHLIDQSPYPSAVHIQSIRLRSIPFSKPTDDYGARNQQEADNKMRKRQRSRAYKESLNEGSGESKEKQTTYLTGSQKRKVAFITQQVNEKADSINAYVTLSPLSEKRLAKLKESNEESVVQNLSAEVLAALLARSAHGSVFEGRHLRVDLVTPLQPSELIESGLDTIKTADGSMLGVTAGGSGVDQEGRRRTAFVGNLDFETNEEEVRTFFNALMIDERGQAPEIPKLDFSRCTKLPKPDKDFTDSQILLRQSWVQDVRIIRDAATQMGKGFAYVKFLDAACVDEVIAMHESEEAFLAAAKAGKSSTPLGQFRRKLKLKGRALRVSLCKVPKGHVVPTNRRQGGSETNGSGSRTPRPASKQPIANGAHRSRSTGAPTPGGTSPFAKRQKVGHSRTAESPTVKRIKSSNPANEGGNLSNPAPKYNDPLKAAQVAQKKADPERQAKRMAKKNAKRASMKMQAVASEFGTTGKVSLKPTAKNTMSKKKSEKSTNKRKAGHSAKIHTRLTSLALLALSMIALILVPSTQANNEIVNFGPIMCAADEHGHLQSKAAKEVSKDWPVLKASKGRQLFSLDPINQPDVWISLAIAEEEEEEEAGKAFSLSESKTIQPIELESKSFPLITREDYLKISPRDRFLQNLVKQVQWNVYSKSFSFRLDWSANFPIRVSAKVHSPHSMLAAGKARWQANQHRFDEDRRTEEQDLLDSPLWPCPRVYVHLHVEIDSVVIPPPTGNKQNSNNSPFSTIYNTILAISERYLAPLTNPNQTSHSSGSTESDKDGKIVSPIPVQLILEHLYLGFIPHTSISLFIVLIPLLLLAYLVIIPLLGKTIQEIARGSDEEIFSINRKTQ